MNHASSIPNAHQEYMKVRQYSYIYVTRCGNISAYYPLHALPGCERTRVPARRRLDFAENSTAGIVGMPRFGASTGHSNYTSALCCRQERTLDPLFIAGDGFRLAPAAESRTESRSCIRSRRFDSLRCETQCIDYRSQIVSRKISRHIQHFI